MAFIVPDIDQKFADQFSISKSDFIEFSKSIGIENAYMIGAFITNHYDECNHFIKSIVNKITEYYSTVPRKYDRPLTEKQKTIFIQAVKDHIAKHRGEEYRPIYHQSKRNFPKSVTTVEIHKTTKKETDPKFEFLTKFE